MSKQKMLGRAEVDVDEPPTGPPCAGPLQRSYQTMFAVSYTDRPCWQQIVAFAQAQRRWQDLIIDDAHLIVLGDVAHDFLAHRTWRGSTVQVTLQTAQDCHGR
jgi:hypothetical protein